MLYKPAQDSSHNLGWSSGDAGTWPATPCVLEHWGGEVTGKLADPNGQRRFLHEVELRPLRIEDARGLEPVGLALGHGTGALEVAVTRAGRRPTQADMRSVWKARHGGRAIPLLLVALYQNKAAICGPVGDAPPVYSELDLGQVEPLCRAALAEPNRHAALRLLRSALPEMESPLPGLRNEGLFASHELQRGVLNRADWQEAQEKSKPLLAKRSRELLKGLGFRIEPLQGPASLLRAGDTRIALAVFLDRSEACDVSSERFSGVSPVSYALAKADTEGLPYVVVDHGTSLRIYPTDPDRGVGQRGRTETFAELHLDLLPMEKAGYLWLLFSGDALARKGSFEDILEKSSVYAADLGSRLRERTYDDVVPGLAMAMAKARSIEKPTAQDLAVTYEMTLAVLFRLLFIAYAEDKDLLPYRTNEQYRLRSLKEKARELVSIKDSGTGFDASTTHWDEVARLWKAIDKGHAEWGVPAYNGGLFAEDEHVFPTGARLSEISLANIEFGPVLTNLLVDETPEGFGPVDFRSLGVREFGTIYEGLLESELSVADGDLALGSDNRYEPAEGRAAAVRSGEIYLHNASGARKSTGSYYTKSFAVKHLLNHSLEPALDDHLERLDALGDREAGDAFFDFRVADIAMGSGHFLVAAVDHIERRLSVYLTKRRLPGVTNELLRLKEAASKAMGVPGESCDIEDTQLLRRQIARRCVYGVDINPLAVQLARLALWIHTFVPGLPLSFLDRNIVCGNSLVGIATIDEALECLGAEALPILRNQVLSILEPARKAVAKLARLSDADASQIATARKAHAEACAATATLEAVCDILAAERLGGIEDSEALGFGEIDSRKVQELHPKAVAALSGLPPFHFPTAFPEVFLRERAGFDVIVGNPPWEEIMCDTDEFWGRYMPGFHGLPQRDREAILPKFQESRPDLEAEYRRTRERVEKLRSAICSGAYPGMETGHPDLYKAFCWRFWNLVCADAGRIGVVLPRAVFGAKGSQDFRKKVLADGSARLTFLLNNRNWVFPDVHPQYTIVLSVITRCGKNERRAVLLSGPFRSYEGFVAGTGRGPAEFDAQEVSAWTDAAALPLLPTEESLAVFAQMRKAPRLDLDAGSFWRARPVQGDINATWGKPLMDLTSDECPKGYWPVYKGASFDIWEPDTGVYYAWADPESMQEHLHGKRLRGRRNRRSAFHEFADPAWFEKMSTLPCLHARIAFRDVTNRTNQRTVLAALVPPRVFIANQAPYLLWPRGNEKDQAFLLGILCSIPLDWYARRFVETHVNFHVLNPFPVPRPDRGDILWQRTVQLSGRLACPDERFAEWAEAVGVECVPLHPDEKDRMIYELDAVVAHLYGLSEAHLRHIFETFHEGWDCAERLEGVLRYFHEWEGRT